MFKYGSPVLPLSHFAIKTPPTDTVSQLDWSPVGNFLVATSWDCTISLYEIDDKGEQSQLKLSQKSNCPLLCNNFSPDGLSILFGGCDNTANIWDLNSNSVVQVAQHNDPVSFCSFVPQHNLVCTGSWDRTLKFWDTRTPNPAVSLNLPNQVFCGEFRGNLGVISCNNVILAYDLSNLNNPAEEIRSTHLKYQIISVATFPSADGFAFGGIDGRVQFHDFKGPTDKNLSYAFKAHRRGDNAYPINALSFNNKTGAIVTCGGDGKVITWDRFSKSKIHEYTPANPLPITSAKFSYDGKLLAYASGYDWHKMINNYDKNKSKPSIIFTYCEKETQLKSLSR